MVMSMIEIVFFTIGLIIIIGFFSLLFFEKTKVPDVLILMSIGVIMGYGLKIADPHVFLSFAPYASTLALIILLFEGGLNLKFHKVIKELPEATGFTLFVFLLNSLFVMLTMNFLFNWNILHALLLGTVVGGTSSAIVISILSKLPVADKPKILLTLESTITDALCIVAAITLVGFIISGSADIREAINDLLSAFSIATVVAFIFGLFWISILARFHGMQFDYLLTIAIIFILYSIVEFAKGNGAISAFVFGFVLGNSTDIARAFKIERNFILDQKIKSFHNEVSFFIRTFFFVYLGLIFNPGVLSAPIILMSFAVLITIILARLISTRLMVLTDLSMKNSEMLINMMLPRGLAAAVLASMPIISEIQITGFTEIVIMIIILTNIIATLGSFLYERKTMAVVNLSAKDL